MANIDDESKSDGLEIISVGALYNGGDWDKKYWSSSRGKDRYPYPVGYQALRTHKGLTYKMEILEGSKGPIFQITSNDKQIGSGETPDRAWENFQKGCSRIKLGHGKRFSGKLDGVEFFGFKNALVQRLLRELVATVNDASDRTSVSTLHKETSPKGKRSRNCKIMDTKSRKSRHVKNQPPLQVNNAKVSYDTPRKTHTDGSLTVNCAMSDFHTDEGLKVLPNLGPGENVPSLANELPSESQDVHANSRTEFLQARIECPSGETCVAPTSLVTSLPHEEKPFDRSCVQANGAGLLVATVEGNKEMQVFPDFQDPGPPLQSDSHANHYSDLIAPDTYETQQEITNDPHFGFYKEEQAIARDEPVLVDLVSEKKISVSHSEEGNQYSNSNSEKSDFDSVDEDITKTMMSILLPQAVPYLTYSLRKKRRKTKPLESSSSVPKVEAGVLASSTSDGQETAHLPSAMDPSLSRMNLIAPESLDNDHSQDLIDNKLPPPSDNDESLIANLHKEKQELSNKLSCAVVDGTNSFLNENKIIPSNETFSHEELQKDFDGFRSLPVLGKQQYCINEHSTMGTYGAPLSESIIYRRTEENVVSKMHHLAGSSVLVNSRQENIFGDGDNTNIDSGFEGQSATSLNQTLKDEFAQNCVSQEQTMNFTIGKNDVQILEGLIVDTEHSNIEKDTISSQKSDQVYQLVGQGRDSSEPLIEEEETRINSISEEKQESRDEMKETMKLIGRYSHPMQISSVTLTRKPQGIYVCVSCGLPEDRKRDLFLYKLTTKEPSLGSPCMVGHTFMSLPFLKDEFGREVALDKSALQFTPDGRGLAVVDSIRMPYCREKNLHCLCAQCEAHCFEENAVKIVRVKLGFVFVVVKLNTMFPVHCVLVCEPDRLVALDESGRIYIWVMDSTWSVQTESYVIPSYEILPSRIIDLKRIPKSASMVVGHNGYGEFSIWDIGKHSVVSRFSAPASSVLDFLPVSMFNLPSKGLNQDKVGIEEYLRKLEEATMSYFPNGANVTCPKEGEDVSVWLLMCTSLDPYPQSSSYSINNMTSNGCWRLGLMIKDVVILGAAFDSSTTAVGISSKNGIIGTLAGQAYFWDLASGSKREALLDLEGSQTGHKVLHIATDDQTSSVVAIARDGGELFVYLQT